MLAARSSAGSPPALPEAVKAALDRGVGPMTLWLGSLAVLAALFWRPALVGRPGRRLAPLNLSLLLLGMSLADRHFAAIVLAPDNVPIVGMVYLLGFFIWLATAQAVENDRRLARPCRRGKSRLRRAGAGLARPGLHRTDRHGLASRRCWSSGRFGCGPRWSSRPIRR